MVMDVVGLCANNKQKPSQMLPNKMRGEFSRNQRKDSEVRVERARFKQFSVACLRGFNAFLADVSININIRTAQML